MATTADAQGRYVFTNVSCPNPCPVFVNSADNRPLASTTVTLGGAQSTTTLDVATAGVVNQALVSGQVVAPPGGADPATIAIRVFQGDQLLADTAVVFPGPGGFGTYRIPVNGPRDTRLPPNSQVRIALFENGVEVASTTATVPPNTGSVVSIVAADLVGQ